MYESAHVHAHAYGLRNKIRRARAREFQGREPPPPEDEERAENEVQYPGNRRRLERGNAVAGRLESARGKSLNSHHGHRHKLEAHITGGLPDDFVADSHNS